MRVLAIDPGTSTGWAAPGASGVIDCSKVGKGRSDEQRHAMIFDRIAATIPDLIHEHRPDALCIEQMVAKGMKGNAARVLLGIRGVILVAATRHGLLIDPVAIPTWQAWAKRQGRTIKTDELDACWIRDWWMAVRAQLVQVEDAALI